MAIGRMGILAIGLAVAASVAAAQALDPAAIGQQNAFFMEQQALRSQALDQERQAFVQEQTAQTNKALSDLAAARAGQPAAITPTRPPSSAALAARADALARQADETAAQL
ncbi:MAG TPA: hypothetical protein VFE03_05875, partial [Caulobacteraceae bacterium]|nr:hypothetical protein [Caulobacteraceae bacterium]